MTRYAVSIRVVEVLDESRPALDAGEHLALLEGEATMPEVVNVFRYLAATVRSRVPWEEADAAASGEAVVMRWLGEP